jgi:hypothetical protein
VSDKAADVPRAHLNNRGCAPRHLEAVSDFIPLEGGSRNDSSFQHTTTTTTTATATTTTTISPSDKIPNAVSPYQTCALKVILNEVAK